MGTVFSETLRSLRKEVGFPTAYRFFYDNGGQPVLGFSYRQYLLMEQGVLPDCGKLEKLIHGLNIVPFGPRANKLVLAWLKTCAGEKEYENFIAPLVAAKAAETLPPEHRALRGVLKSRVYHVSPKQFSYILTDFDTFLCFNALSEDVGEWTSSQLAEALCLSNVAVERAMNTLVRAKLVKKMKGDLYKCPVATKMLQYPQLHLIDKALSEKAGKFLEKLALSGKVVWRNVGIVRADADTMINSYVPLMMNTIQSAHAHRVVSKSANSAMFYVESRLVRLREF